jgi:hypothetical protein
MTLTTVRHACDTSGMRIPHAVLRRNLAHPEAVIARAAVNPPLGVEICLYFGVVFELIRLHHTAQAVVLWPRLRERVPEESALFDRMERQCTALEDATAAAERALIAFKREATPVHGRRLAEAIRTLAKVLDVHLADEERDILPIAAQNMDQEEWDQMAGYALSHYSGGKPWLPLGLLFDQMTAEEREMMLGTLSPQLLVIWEGDGPGQYRELMTHVRPGMTI